MAFFVIKRLYDTAVSKKNYIVTSVFASYVQKCTQQRK